MLQCFAICRQYFSSESGGQGALFKIPNRGEQGAAADLNAVGSVWVEQRTGVVLWIAGFRLSEANIKFVAVSKEKRIDHGRTDVLPRGATGAA